VTIALSLNLPTNVSDAQVSRGCVTLGQNLGRGWPMSYAKEIVLISSAIRAQFTNVTDRQTMER